MSAAGHSDTPWRPLADFEWTERAFDLLEAGRLQAEVQHRSGVVSTRVWGVCPRCGCGLDDRQVHSAVVDLLGNALRGAGDPPGDLPLLIPVDVTCGCGLTHSGAPEETTGCGVSFRVELELDPAATQTR